MIHPPFARTAAALAMLGAVAVLGAAPALADTPGEHAHYLHALTDLRVARAYLARGDERNVERDEHVAIIEIDQAIGEARNAAVDDGKNLDDHPFVDVNLAHQYRLRRALDALYAARIDLSYTETNGAAIGWQTAAIGEVNFAIEAAQRSITDKRLDEQMDGAPPVPGGPEYLHALSDLRYARALLTYNSVDGFNADAGSAIGQIDQAIDEARRAAFDDGRPLGDHPPVDFSLRPRDRVARAIEALERAHSDLVSNPEYNQDAAGWRSRAIHDVDVALTFSRRALFD